MHRANGMESDQSVVDENGGRRKTRDQELDELSICRKDKGDSKAL